MVPDPVWAFGREVADRLSSVLGVRLVGTYFVGSVALGGYVAGESDIDIKAVCRDSLDLDTKRSVIDAVEMAIGSCPARGLEFTIYRSEVAGSARAPSGAGFEVNVNGGPRMDRVVRTDPQGQPPFWYIIDRAIAHRAGVTIIRTPLAMRCPLSIAAACRRSSSRPFVHVPIKAKLIFCPFTCGTPITSSIW